jgi:tetratricopeptide (TPR) repeat protein
MEDYYIKNQINSCYLNECMVSKALQVLLVGMKKFEESELVVKGLRHIQYGEDYKVISRYFEDRQIDFNDQSILVNNVKICYRVKFYYFLEGRNAFTYSINQKLEHIKRKREVVVKLIEKFKYNKAVKVLKVITEFCTLGVEEEHKNELKPFHLSALLNLSLCFWKLKNWEQMKQHSKKVLEVEPLNVKGIYRLAFAESAQCNYERAILIIDQHEEQKNDDLRNLRAEIVHKLKDVRVKEKKMYSRIFKEDENLTN